MGIADLENENSMRSIIMAGHGGAGRAPERLSPLILAYIGDTVYDLFIRSSLISASDAGVSELHKKAVRLVCASAQAEAFRRIEPELCERELEIYKRGRNSHLGGVPRSATVSDYRTATGLEALVGYLFLSGQDDRLAALMKNILGGTTDAADKT